MKNKKPREFSEGEIENLKWLSEQARKRLESRRAVEWKLFIGTWTALLVASGLIVSIEDTLPFWTVFVAAAFAVLIIWACIFFELWLMRHQLNDARLGYWFSTAIADGMHATPPADLHPKGWTRFDGAFDKCKATPTLTLIRNRIRVHIPTGIQAFKISVTVMLSTLFVLATRMQATWSRTNSHYAGWVAVVAVAAIFLIVCVADIFAVAVAVAYEDGRRSESPDSSCETATRPENK